MTQEKNVSIPSRRRKARQLLLQALYQWQMSGADVTEVEAEFRTDNDMSKVDGEFFTEVLHGVPRQLDKIDAAYASHLDRKLEELDPISISLLRMGSFELINRIDIPYKVVINEAVNLAKKFGPTDTYKFINGILDRVASDSRSIEVAAAKK